MQSHHEEQEITGMMLAFPGVMGTEERGVLTVKEPHVSSSDFSLFLGGEDTCKLDLLQLQTLTSCGFNSSNPLIIITHGWSVRSTPAFFTLH